MGRDLLGVYHLLEDQIYVYGRWRKAAWVHTRPSTASTATTRANFSGAAMRASR